MPLLRATAELLSQEQMERGIIEEIIDKDDLFAVLPFKQIVGKAYVYDRELTLSEGEFIDVNDDVPEGAATFEEVVAKLARLAGDVDVDKFLDETMSDIHDQKATQIAAKAKALGRKFKRTLATGDRTVDTKAFDGIAKLVSAGQTIDAGTDGNPLSFSMLDELLDAIPYGADAIVMRSGTARAYRALLRATNAGPGEVMMENFGRPMLQHNGVPIIVNDFLPGNEVKGASSTTCSIYAGRFNEADGLHGIYGGPSAGIRIEDIGTVQTKDASRTRLKWYAALALKSTKSLARIRGVTNSGGQNQSGTGKPVGF